MLQVCEALSETDKCESGNVLPWLFYTLKNAGFSLFGQFIGLFFYVFTQVLGYFKTQMSSACWVISLCYFVFIFFPGAG